MAKARVIIGSMLLVAMLVVGGRRILPTLEHLEHNAFSMLLLLLVVGLVTWAIVRVLRD